MWRGLKNKNAYKQPSCFQGYFPVPDFSINKQNYYFISLQHLTFLFHLSFIELLSHLLLYLIFFPSPLILFCFSMLIQFIIPLHILFLLLSRETSPSALKASFSEELSGQKQIKVGGSDLKGYGVEVVIQ